MPLQVIVGSFIWGSSKMKVKKSGGHEGAGEADHQTVEHVVTQNTIQPSQNLTPTASVGVWSGSRPMDIRDTHVDIDLMRG